MHMSVAQAYAILEHSSVVELPAYIRRVPGSIPGVPIFQNGGIAMISEFVEYVKQVWKNKPNVSSPLNADRLNHMESGIENNSKKIKETVTAVNELTENSKWKLFGSRTGSNRLGIKELVDAGREIKVVVEAQYSNVGERTKFVFYLLPSEDIKGIYSSGYCFSSTNYASVSISVSSDLSVLIMPSWWKMVENASNTIALNDTTATLKVYYR